MTQGAGLNQDAFVTVCVCTALGRKQAGTKPLNVREWTDLVRQLQAGNDTPAALLSLGESDLQERFGLSPELAKRLSELVRGAGSVGVELERLTAVGIWTLTRGDSDYPRAWKRKLGHAAPPVLFGAGCRDHLQLDLVAIVGSRDVDQAGEAFADDLARACVEDGLGVVSGGARGVDRVATDAALDAGGPAVGILADSLERATEKKAIREAIVDERLALVTPYLPHGGFTSGKAMGRNRLIYATARYACVAATTEGRGGTWTGAIEAMRKSLAPVFVRSADDAPKGNAALVREGAHELRWSERKSDVKLADWLEAQLTPTDPVVREGRQATFDF